MNERLLNIVTNLGSPKILVVGDFMVDIYVYGDALRISPEAPVPVLKVTDTEYRCGGAGSVAVNLAALGAQPICVGVTGDDANGQILKEKLTQCSVDISGLFTATDRPTINKQRLIGLAQHRHRQQLIRMDQESIEPLSEKQYDNILKTFEHKLTQADIVCLQDYNKGLLSSRICKEMIQLANNTNKRVLVDPCLTSDYSKYINATVITPNRKETSAAVKFEVDDISSVTKAAEQLYRSLKLSSVVITLDREGAFLKTDTICELIPTKPKSVYDVTGAGDMVLATLAITLAAGCDYKTAVQLSNITGGIEVEKFGAVPVSIEEIIKEIVDQDQSINGKILSIESLLKELQWRRSQNQTIVFTNGCFDILHRGHIEYLRFCKSQGNVVVVGVNSDSSVKKIKGADRPINNQDDRATVVAALESVDYVTIFDEPDPLNLIKKVKPDVLVKGQDWAGKGVVGREFVESYDGKVILAPLIEGKSSTETIEKVRLLQSEL